MNLPPVLSDYGSIYAERVVEEVIAAEREEAQIQLADNSDLVKTLNSMFDKKDHTNGIQARNIYRKSA